MALLVLLAAILLSAPAHCWIDPEYVDPNPDPRLQANFRPPSVPLVVHDPYMSIWSDTDTLYGGCPKHWTGAVNCMIGMIRVGSRLFRFMGKDDADINFYYDYSPLTMKQVKMTVYPTQTIYIFQRGGVQLTLTFTTPAFGHIFPTDSWSLHALPLTYITFQVESIDQKPHPVKIYFDITGEATVSSDATEVLGSTVVVNDTVYHSVGNVQQNPVSSTTDRINWGYLYVAIPQSNGTSSGVFYATKSRSYFMSGLPVPNAEGPLQARVDQSLVVAASWDLGVVKGPVSTYLTLVYDNLQGIYYFGTQMIPLWKHYFNNVSALLQGIPYHTMKLVCDELDDGIVQQLYTVGGANYSSIASLAWRQTLGGLQAVYNPVLNTSWIFLKEMSSCGCVSTVDVTFPASPQLLWSDPEVLRQIIVPVFDYANNQTYKYGLKINYTFAFAPHHLGYWPICNLPPSGQENMPIEETANLILMVAAIVQRQSNNITWLAPYWRILIQWGDYLMANLPDPELQLCTDDFRGLLKHNVNLAAKGILGVAALGSLLEIKGNKVEAESFISRAQFFVKWWMDHGINTDGQAPHYRLNFRHNGWSLKYNLLYQRILDMKNMFPDEVFCAEGAWYDSHMRRCGVDLDGPSNFTKIDWEMWAAAMGNETHFQTITNHVYYFANHTRSRVPLTDWYFTETCLKTAFMARPVIGGFFARMLTFKNQPVCT